MTHCAAASESATEPPDTPAGKTLSENAEDFMNSKSAQKRKYDEVEVTTGEENEFNVIQTRAKLYFFENSNWVERGRGQLRLNDMTAEADAAAGKHDGAGAKISSKAGLVFVHSHNSQMNPAATSVVLGHPSVGKKNLKTKWLMWVLRLTFQGRQH